MEALHLSEVSCKGTHALLVGNIDVDHSEHCVAASDNEAAVGQAVLALDDAIVAVPGIVADIADLDTVADEDS